MRPHFIFSLFFALLMGANTIFAQGTDAKPPLPFEDLAWYRLSPGVEGPVDVLRVKQDTSDGSWWVTCDGGASLYAWIFKTLPDGRVLIGYADLALEGPIRQKSDWVSDGLLYEGGLLVAWPLALRFNAPATTTAAIPQWKAPEQTPATVAPAEAPTTKKGKAKRKKG